MHASKPKIMELSAGNGLVAYSIHTVRKWIRAIGTIAGYHNVPRSITSDPGQSFGKGTGGGYSAREFSRGRVTLSAYIG